MYFTLKYLAPPKYVPIIAWIDGTSLCVNHLSLSLSLYLSRLPARRASIEKLCQFFI